MAKLEELILLKFENISEFAKACEMKPQQVYRYLGNNPQIPRIRNVRKIAKALGENPGKIFDIFLQR